MHASLLVVVALLVSCGSPPKDEAIGRSRAQHGTMPAAFTGYKPALSDATVLNFLPDSTLMAGFVANPKELAESLEFTTILQEYPGFYASATSLLSMPSGAHVLQPASWPKFGVNPERPIALALVLPERLIALVSVTLSNKIQFRDSLRALTKRFRIGELLTSSHGESTIYRFTEESNIAIVVRADVAILVIPERRSNLEPMLEHLSGARSLPTLAETGRVAQAFAGFDHGKDVAGFIAIDTIVAAFQSLKTFDLAQERVQWAQVSLQALQSTIDHSEEDVKRLQAALAERIAEAEDERLADLREKRWFSEVVTPLGTIALGINTTRPTTTLRAQLNLDRASLPAKLLANNARPLALLGRLSEPPIFLLGAHLNIDTAKKIFESSLHDGNLSEISEALHAELQTDNTLLGPHLETLVGLFDGEFSGAFTAAPIATADTHNYSDVVGIHLLAHLSDSGAAQALLERVATSTALAVFAKTNAGTTVLEVPGFGNRNIRISVSNDYLEVKTMRKGAGASWSEAETHVLQAPHTQAQMLIDPAMLAWWLSPPQFHSFPGQQDADAATQAKRAKLESEMEALQKERFQMHFDGNLKTRPAVGRIVFSAQAHGGGLAVIGRTTSTSASLGRSIQTFIQALVPEISNSFQGSPLHKLDQRLEIIQEALWRL